MRGFDVRYAPVYREGSGSRVPLLGASDLRVIVRAPAYDRYGQPTYSPRNSSKLVDVAGYRTFVIPMSGGVSRLVIDVAHRW